MNDALVATWASVFSARSYVFATGRDVADSPGIPRARTEELATVVRTNDSTDAWIGGLPVPELLEQLRGGRLEAYEILYTSMFKTLWSLAVLQTHSREIAEEIVHDVFLRLWVGRATLRIDGDLRVYLSAAVRNAARNLHKHGKVVDALEDAVERTGMPLPAIGEPSVASDTAVERAEFLVAYHRALLALTEQEQTAAYLRWEEGWSFERIGEVLALSKMGAHKVVARAQRKVQALLADFRD